MYYSGGSFRNSKRSFRHNSSIERASLSSSSNLSQYTPGEAAINLSCERRIFVGQSVRADPVAPKDVPHDKINIDAFVWSAKILMF